MRQLLLAVDIGETRCRNCPMVVHHACAVFQQQLGTDPEHYYLRLPECVRAEAQAALFTEQPDRAVMH